MLPFITTIHIAICTITVAGIFVPCWIYYSKNQ